MSLCRNGHDLALVGRIVSDARGVYRKCLACRRAAKDRENAREREKRAASGKSRKDVCRNGHPRSMSRRTSSGGLRCRECDRLTAERRRERGSDIFTRFTPYGVAHFTATHQIRDSRGCYEAPRVSQFDDGTVWCINPDGYNAGLYAPTLDEALRWLMDGA